MTGLLSIGIAAAAGPEVAEQLAPAAERAGLHALWVNDTPGNDALEVLAAAAQATERLVLATGVIPVDRRGADEIRARVAELGLPADRLVLGIGSGSGAVGALARVTNAARALGSGEPVCDRVVVGALGPKMRRRAVEVSDGVLLSWLTPDAARAQAAEAREVAPETHVALYVRAATDAAAVGRMDREAARYAGFPAYRANLERLGIDVRDTVIRPEVLAAGIRHYCHTVDEVVLRAMVANDDADDYLRFIEAVGEAIPG